MAIALLAMAPTSHTDRQAPAQEPTPRILLDAAPRAIEYQLGRLTNAELVRVERKPEDSRYRLVYYALLTRKGLAREYVDEALAVLTKMDKASQTTVLLEALSRVGVEDDETAGKLLNVLLGQPSDELRKSRDAFTKAIELPASPRGLQASYGGLLLAGTDPRPVWDAAAGREGHLIELLRSVPHLGNAKELRARLFDPIAALLADRKNPAIRAAAVSALVWTRADAATFRLIAREGLETSDPEVRAAAIGALPQIPKEAWPPAEIAPLVGALLEGLRATAPDLRTEPSSPSNDDAMQLAEKLADALPDDERRAARKELRAMGVQVVRIQTVPEQMSFDVKWFAVEAGKNVQVVFSNPDVMSHNLLIGNPGSLREMATAAGTLTMAANPNVKAFVPDSPLVLHATRLLNWGETERLSFQAPAEPGEYPFLCTFPGHWVRMYGVMLVVSNIDAWESKRTVPNDPMTNQPFASERH
jgi:azurin/DNA-binding transcriptional ArsR family regulator